MSVYQLKTFADIYSSIREELGVQSTDTTAINRIKRLVNVIYSEVVAKKTWWWLSGSTDITLPAYINAGTASVVQGSNVVTLTIAPGPSKTKYKFALDGYSEIYEIESHTAGSATVRLKTNYSGTTNTAANYKIWTDKLPLPTDCKETTEVWHDFYRNPLDNVGRDEFRRMQRANPRNEAKPLAYYTGDFKDPTQLVAISSLPSVLTRSSAGTIKTIIFNNSIPLSIATSVTNGDPVQWNISSAGDPSYNGNIKIDSVSTTSVLNDTVTYTGVMELQESAVSDSTMVIKSVNAEQDYARYRELFIYPALTNTPVTLHVDYTKEALPLNNDSDEPLMPLHDRIVLRHGALSILWSSIGRNPEEAVRNKALYDEKFNQMASKWQDATSTATLKPSKNYLGAKRNAIRTRLLDNDYGPLIAGGAGSGQQVSGAPNQAAIFDANGILKGDSLVSTTKLEYLQNVTSDIQTQLNSKQSSTLSNADILVGNASNVATAVPMTGDVSIANTGVTTVSTVGGSTASNIHTAEQLVNTAQSGNKVLASPSNGSSGAPAFRTLTVADLPTVGIAQGGTGQTTQQAAIDALLPSQTSNSGKVLGTNGTTSSWVATSTGTVTSVGLSMPGEFSVASSPVTTSGTIAVTKANQNANTIYAGPSSGAAAAPTFRSLVGAESLGVLLATATASNSATIDFTSISNSTYDSYIIVADNIVPVTNLTFLQMRVSVGGVFQSGASAYQHSLIRFANAGAAGSGSSGDTLMSISSTSDGITNTSNDGLSFRLIAYNQAQTSTVKRYSWVGGYQGSAYLGICGSGQFSTVGSAVDGFRFFMSSGNISSGTFKLYGLRSS